MKLPGSVNIGVQSLPMQQSKASATLARGAAISQGLNAIGGAHDEYEEKKARDFALEQNNHFSKAFADEDARLKQESKTGDDYAEGMKLFFETQKKESVGLAKGNRQTILSENLHEGFKGKYASHINNATTLLNNKYSEGLIGDLVNTETNNVYNNPDQLKQSINVSKAAIEASGLSSQRKDELIRGVRSNMRYVQISSIIANDPQKAIKLLQSDEYAEKVEPEKVLQLTRLATASQQAQEASYQAMIAKADKYAEDSEKELEEATAKTLYEADSTNTLTIEDVYENRENLSQADYKYFIGQASGAAATAVTNVDTYASLTTLAQSNPIQAKADAKTALLNKDLTISHYDKIVSLANKEEKGELPTPYKQATSYLTRISRTSELNPPVGSADRYANAMDDYNQWYQNNQHVDAIEATDKARSIWNQYKLVESPIIVSGVMPYGVNASRTKMSLEDLKPAATKLFKDHKDGIISDEEFEKQKQIFIEWKSYLESKQEPESKQ